MADLVTKIAVQDHRLAVAMLGLVCPKAIDATVRHEQQMLLSVEDLDRSLASVGLPSSREIFQLDYSSEAEVVEAEDSTKKLQK